MSSLMLGSLCCLLPLGLAALVALIVLAVRDLGPGGPPLRDGGGPGHPPTHPDRVDPPSPSGPGHQLP